MKRPATLVEYEAASPETRIVYDEILRTLGVNKVPNWLSAQGGNPRVLRANWEKFKHTVFEGEVPPLLKQLILYVISARANNQYCVMAHGYAALSLDSTLTCEDLECLVRGESYEGLPESYKVALEVVTRLALDRGAVAPGDFVAQLRGAGFSSREIDELLAQADFGIMLNVIMDINEVPLDKPYPPPQETAA